MANQVVNGITNLEPVRPISLLPQRQPLLHEHAGIIADEPLQIGVPERSARTQTAATAVAKCVCGC
jgi:hypothetical protein